MVELSKIERVELREVWPDEAADFTPWLAENLSQLGEALGLDLDIRGTEVPVGSYSLDILANDIGSDRPVIVENQLEKTDHTHLGQILTYAAGHDAETIVWIAKGFSDEHRAALDYLNGRTGEDTKFFGVVVEVLKIDNSRPAVNFDLVVTPNVVKKQTDPLPPGGKKYRTFWQPLVDTLREGRGFKKIPDAPPINELRINTGLSGVRYVLVFAQAKEFSVDLYIDGSKKELNKQLFDNLKGQRKESIESEFGKTLEWMRLDHKTPYHIRVSSSYRGTIDDDENTLEEIREWMIKGLLVFKKEFGPILGELAE